jgi:hypothetical protein
VKLNIKNNIAIKIIAFLFGRLKYFIYLCIKLILKILYPMKKITLVLGVLLLAIAFSSCEDAGTTRNTLNGAEEKLSQELKGLKIYDMSTGSGSYVKVAVLNGAVNSTTYSVGKSHQSTIIINNQNTGKVINIESIISENDSIIVAKKSQIVN